MNDNPTNSQIDAAVHEALGWCICEELRDVKSAQNKNAWQYKLNHGDIRTHRWICKVCNNPAWARPTYEPIPPEPLHLWPLFTTDPRLFWPLAEGWDFIRYVQKDGGTELEILLDGSGRSLTTKATTMGRAICLAWLEMKGVKVNG